MLESSASRGVKRKLRLERYDGLESETAELRQKILNLSMSKLNAVRANPEACLRRTVLLANTVRFIEKDIEAEQNVMTDVIMNYAKSLEIERITPASTLDINANNINPSETCVFERTRVNDSKLNSLKLAASKRVENLYRIEKSSDLPADQGYNLEGVKHGVMEARPKVTNSQVGVNNSSPVSTDTSIAPRREEHLQEAKPEIIPDDKNTSLCSVGEDYSLEIFFSDISMYDFESCRPVCCLEELGFNVLNNSCHKCTDDMKLERKNELCFLDELDNLLVGI